MIKIKEIWFSDDQIFGRGEDGRIYSQSLLWYPRLRAASAEEREKYTFGFESFVYEDAQPTPMQKFFLTHKEINIAEFARSIGMNATLLRNYINGFKKPSVEREKAILAHIHQLGQELMAANFSKN